MMKSTEEKLVVKQSRDMCYSRSKHILNNLINIYINLIDTYIYNVYINIYIYIYIQIYIYNVNRYSICNYTIHII